MSLYKSAVRPALFHMPADPAHSIGKAALRRRWLWASRRKTYAVSDPRLRVSLAGVKLASPVGLAAGLDKDCQMLDAIQSLGFGYAIPGSIRGEPAGDNPEPRYHRYVDRESLVNCTGFPSRGSRYARKRLEKFQQRRAGLVVIPNVTGFSVDEYITALEMVQRYGDAVEISLSCPNEQYDETDFLNPPTFARLMTALNRHKRAPFFVKIRNHNNEEERANRHRLIELCMEFGVDGITLPGSHIVEEPALSMGRGNLSGRAVLSRTIENVRDVYRLTGGRIAIKALGGIFTAEDAYEAISAGATSVELLTGLIYEGWSVARDINTGLLELLTANGIANLGELVGRTASLDDGIAS